MIADLKKEMPCKSQKLRKLLNYILNIKTVLIVNKRIICTKKVNATNIRVILTFERHTNKVDKATVKGINKKVIAK